MNGCISYEPGRRLNVLVCGSGYTDMVLKQTTGSYTCPVKENKASIEWCSGYCNPKLARCNGGIGDIPPCWNNGKNSKDCLFSEKINNGACDRQCGESGYKDSFCYDPACKEEEMSALKKTMDRADAALEFSKRSGRTMYKCSEYGFLIGEGGVFDSIHCSNEVCEGDENYADDQCVYDRPFCKNRCDCPEECPLGSVCWSNQCLSCKNFEELLATDKKYLESSDLLEYATALWEDRCHLTCDEAPGMFCSNEICEGDADKKGDQCDNTRPFCTASCDCSEECKDGKVCAEMVNDRPKAYTKKCIYCWDLWNMIIEESKGYPTMKDYLAEHDSYIYLWESECFASSGLTLALRVYDDFLPAPIFEGALRDDLFTKN